MNMFGVPKYTVNTDPEELEERVARGKRVAEMVQKQIMMVVRALQNALPVSWM
jgi:hypothetical protein